jgi:hypothetical protein
MESDMSTRWMPTGQLMDFSVKDYSEPDNDNAFMVNESITTNRIQIIASRKNQNVVFSNYDAKIDGVTVALARGDAYV